MIKIELKPRKNVAVLNSSQLKTRIVTEIENKLCNLV